MNFFGLDGLTHFVDEMFKRGYEVKRMRAWGGDDVIRNSGLDVSNAEEVAYQGLNYEETWVVFEHPTADTQSAKFMLTGDKWCDVVPIADWTFKRNGTDVIKEVYDELREIYLKKWEDSK